MKRWMVVAEPLVRADEISVAAAQAWNIAWLGADSNRYRWKHRAAVAIAEVHDPVWGRWVHFRVARVR